MEVVYIVNCTFLLAIAILPNSAIASTHDLKQKRWLDFEKNISNIWISLIRMLQSSCSISTV